MVRVRILNKPKSFMKRIPVGDIMLETMERAENNEFYDYEIFLARKDKKRTVGWGILYWEKYRKMPWFMVWTCPCFRKKGVGSIIFREAAKFADKMGVCIYDERSEHFFRKAAKDNGVQVININER